MGDLCLVPRWDIAPRPAKSSANGHVVQIYVGLHDYQLKVPELQRD